MTNEAADRLRELLKGSRQEGMTGEEALRDRFGEWEHAEEWNLALDQALAAERRATVERILDALQHDHAMFVRVQLIGNRILDAEVSVVSTDSQQAER